MKKNLKRMLAFVSAVIMVLTMLPVGVLAETEEVETPAEQLLEKPAAEVAEQQPVQPQEESTPAPATEAPKSEAPASEEPSESPEVPETPSSTYSVIYKDGKGGAIFEDQVYEGLMAGDITPDFLVNGKKADPQWANHIFTGWSPKVEAKVNGDVVYTAQWSPVYPKSVTIVDDCLTIHCTGDHTHEDFTAKAWNATTAGGRKPVYNEERGVWTVEASINPNSLYSVYLQKTSPWGKRKHDAANFMLINLVWSEEQAKWLPDTEGNQPIVVNYVCYDKPAVPKALTSYKSTSFIKLIDTDNPRGKTYLPQWKRVDIDHPNSYAFGEVTQKENGDFSCILTITDLSSYIGYYNEKYQGTGIPFVLDTEKTAQPITVEFTYKKNDVEYKQDGSGWITPQITNVYIYRRYAVTYTDGVGGEAFADQVYNVKPDAATPEFNGTPSRTGYAFLGWQPAVADTVTANVTYVAQWAKLYTVTYTDGMDGKVFADQVFTVKEGEQTPAFDAPATWQGAEAWELYEFNGWTPEVAEKVTENQTYTAQYTPGWNTCLVSYYMQELDGSYTLMKELSFNALYGAEVEADVEPIPEHFHLNAEKSVLKGTIMREGDGIPGGAALSVYYDRDVYTVTYEDGVKGKAFKAQGYEVMYGEKTPAFEGTPKREGFRFHGWKPEVAETVSGDVVYTATWYVPGTSDVPSTGDVNRVTRIASLLGMALMAAAGCAAAAGSKRASRKED